MAGPVGGLCRVPHASSHRSSAPGRHFKHAQLLFPWEVALQEDSQALWFTGGPLRIREDVP